MYLAYRKSKIGTTCSFCRVRGQKSKLSFRHAKLGAVKVKKKRKLEIFRPAHCSLYLLWSQERERKKLISLFFLFTATEVEYLAAERAGPQWKQKTTAFSHLSFWSLLSHLWGDLLVWTGHSFIIEFSLVIKSPSPIQSLKHKASSLSPGWASAQERQKQDHVFSSLFLSTRISSTSSTPPGGHWLLWG